MNSFTQKVTAWLPKYAYLTPEDFAAQKPGIAGALGYTSNPKQDMGEQGWTKLGTAEITLHLIDNDTMVLNKIESLKAEAKKTRAEATKRCNEIEGQIQNLLAITYTPNANDELRG